MALYQQLLRYGGDPRNLLSKALSSASNSGSALVPQHLEQIITNTVIQLDPMFAMLKHEFDPQKLHEFNQVTSLGTLGASAQGENGVTPNYQSVYSRSNVTLKIVRRKGSVTNFLQDASSKYIDAYAQELENQLRAHIYDVNTYVLYGNTADQYQFSGLDSLIATNRIQGHTAGVPTVPTSLAFLDTMIDANIQYGGSLHDKVFYMSPQMLSKVSSLLTNVRLNQGIIGNGITQIDINGGWRLDAYRGIPIIPTTMCSGTLSGTMGTITLGQAASGGSLSNGTYYVRVAAVTAFGEQQASAETSITVNGGGSAQRITVSFTAVSGAIGYKVYASATSGLTNTKLVDWQAANTYDGNGTVTAGGTTSFSILSMTPTTNITTAQQADMPLTAVGGINGEIVVLHDLDKYQGLGKFPYTNAGGNRVDGVVSIKPLAETDDFLPFLCKTYGALCPSFEATSVISRGWRVA